MKGHKANCLKNITSPKEGNKTYKPKRCLFSMIVTDHLRLSTLPRKACSRLRDSWVREIEKVRTLGPFIRGKIRRVLHKTRVNQDANCTIDTSMSYLRQEQLV